eukprot:scaffold143721_cov16-Tisochrysis_lutea.AAC.1
MTRGSRTAAAATAAAAPQRAVRWVPGAWVREGWAQDPGAPTTPPCPCTQTLLLQLCAMAMLEE